MSNKFLKCASWVILSRYLCGTVKRLRLQLPILKLNYDSFSSWPSYNPFIAFIAFRNNGYDPRSLDYTPIKAAAQKVSLIRSCAQRKEDFDNSGSIRNSSIALRGKKEGRRSPFLSSDGAIDSLWDGMTALLHGKNPLSAFWPMARRAPMSPGPMGCVRPVSSEAKEINCFGWLTGAIMQTQLLWQEFRKRLSSSSFHPSSSLKKGR